VTKTTTAVTGLTEASVIYTSDGVASSAM